MLRKDVLVLGSHCPGNASVISEYLFSFQKHSRHRFFYLTHPEDLHPGFDFERFDALLLFWSYPWGTYPDIPAEVVEQIAACRSLKIMMLQDEYRRIRLTNLLMRRLGINVMLTCVQPEQYELFYPRRLIPSLRHLSTVLTGYVSKQLEQVAPPDWQTRPVDVGYRSRRLPYHLGDLAQEKCWIGERFSRICSEQGLRADISTHEQDCIYGRAWIDFLCRCRFVLGTESGASVLDFTSDVEAQCQEHLRAHPGATYQDIKQAFFASLDWQHSIRTISPRIFESVACHNVMLLHEGMYAGILEPDVHYISIHKDYSNQAEVLERMRDAGFCRQLREKAYDDLIASGRFRYSALVQQVDQILERFAPAPPCPRKGLPPLAFHLSTYLRHGHTVIPSGDGCLTPPTWTGIFQFCWLLWQLLVQPVLLLILLLLPEVLGYLVIRKVFRALWKNEEPHQETQTAGSHCPLATSRVWSLITGALSKVQAGLSQSVQGLMVLAIVRRIQSGVLHYGAPLRVQLEVDEVNRRITLRTLPRQTSQLADEQQRQWQRFQRLLNQKGLLTFHFDNSRFHRFIPLRALDWFRVSYFIGWDRQVSLILLFSWLFARHPWCARSFYRFLQPPTGAGQYTNLPSVLETQMHCRVKANASLSQEEPR